MNNSIHPNYHFIKIVMTDGSTYQTRSTYGKEGDTLTLEVDSISHPAYNKDKKVEARGDQVSKFKNRFGNLLKP